MYFENKLLKALIKAHRLKQKEKKDDNDLEAIKSFLDNHIIDFIKWRVHPSSTVYSKMMTMKDICDFNSSWLAKQTKKKDVNI